MKTLGIISLDFNNYNYGGALQQFALEYFLNKKKYNVRTFNIDIKHERSLHYTTGFLKSIKHFAGKCLRSIKNLKYIRAKKILNPRYKKFDTFRKDFYNNCEKVTVENIDVENYDAFICGSDQIWQPAWARKSLFLDFVPDNKRKIIYAASIGRENLDNEDKLIYQPMIDRLDFISVREKSAKTVLESFITKKDIPVVLDPTLLLDKQDWEKFASNDYNEENYVFTYFLTKNENFNIAVKTFATSQNLKIFNITYATSSTHGEENSFGDYNISDAGPCQFLELIKKAKYVFTDSFHACVFSIIFEKEFFVFDRKINGESMLGRVNTLLSYFDIKRVVDESSSFESFEKIDYSYKDKILSDLRKSSDDFLNLAIEGKKAKETVVNSPIDCTGCGRCAKICPVKAISYVTNYDGFLIPKIDPNKCVHCGKCFSSCIQRQTYQKSKFKNGIFALIKKTPPEKKTSSAGVFGQLAKDTIKKGGVVYSTIYDKNSSKYIRLENTEDLQKTYGSKYFQINLSKVVDSIEADVKTGKPVLVVGTPCQIAGLKSLYQQDNLILVALVCHGVPSQKLFGKITTCEFGEIPNDVDFRYKNPSWDKYKIVYHLNDKIIEVPTCESTFMNLFLNDVILNDCCYNCHYAGNDYGADLLIGDAWGLQKINHSMYKNSKFGASFVVPNTNKGLQLFKEISDEFFVYKIPKCKYKYISENIFKPFDISTKKYLKYDYLKATEQSGFKKIEKQEKRTFMQRVKNKIKKIFKI